MTIDFDFLRAVTDTPTHRAEVETALLRAELRAKSEAAHPSRVARRMEVDAENARRVRVLRTPSPQSSVDAFDALGCDLADVIDLGAKRGGRRG